MPKLTPLTIRRALLEALIILGMAAVLGVLNLKFWEGLALVLGLNTWIWAMIRVETG